MRWSFALKYGKDHLSHRCLLSTNEKAINLLLIKNFTTADDEHELLEAKNTGGGTMSSLLLFVPRWARQAKDRHAAASTT